MRGYAEVDKIPIPKPHLGCYVFGCLRGRNTEMGLPFAPNAALSREGRLAYRRLRRVFVVGPTLWRASASYGFP